MWRNKMESMPINFKEKLAKFTDHWNSSHLKIKEPKMAYIDYIAQEMIPPDDRVPDQDNILRIHGAHSRTMRQHYDLYKQLMYSKGPLSRIQREMIAVVVSAENKCHY
jgi:alkylhydroperoxidase family enzyme